jgi:hypothetical protein
MMWKSLFAVFCCMLMFTNCKKENSVASLSSNPTSYELTSIVWSGPTTNGQSFYFTFNSSHLLTDYKRIQWGQGGYNITDSGNIPLPGWADTGYYHLEYSNGRVARQYIADTVGGMFGYWTYAYNSQGWLTSVRTYYLNGQPENITYTYQYNGMGQVTDMWEYGATPMPDYHSVYSYDSKGDLEREVDSTLFTDPVWIQVTDYTSYDNGINVARALNGYVLSTSTTNNFGFSSSISPNNVTGISYYGSIVPGDPFGLLAVDSSSYQYNDAGLPVQQLAGPWIITYTYTKY